MLIASNISTVNATYQAQHAVEKAKAEAAVQALAMALGHRRNELQGADEARVKVLADKIAAYKASANANNDEQSAKLAALRANFTAEAAVRERELLALLKRAQDVQQALETGGGGFNPPWANATRVAASRLRPHRLSCASSPLWIGGHPEVLRPLTCGSSRQTPSGSAAASFRRALHARTRTRPPGRGSRRRRQQRGLLTPGLQTYGRPLALASLQTWPATEPRHFEAWQDRSSLLQGAA